METQQLLQYNTVQHLAEEKSFHPMSVVVWPPISSLEKPHINFFGTNLILECCESHQFSGIIRYSSVAALNGV